MRYVSLEDTIYFHLSLANSDGGEAFVRECGATDSAAPVFSVAATLLTHADYDSFAYEVAIPATTANGFTDETEYALFFVPDAGGSLHLGNFTVGSLTASIPPETITVFAEETAAEIDVPGGVQEGMDLQGYSAPRAENLDNIGTAVHGPGADQVTIPIVNTDTGNPVQGASVWITLDAAGENVVAGPKTTNSDGLVTFALDDGVQYRLWMRKDGVTDIRGLLFTAEAD